MLNDDTFQYVLENTRVIRSPKQRIETFGTTRFHFYLLSELMDSVGEVRIRDGEIQAERPQIVTPESYTRVLLDGFGEQAHEFVDWMKEHARNFAIMKYGFQFRRTNLSENIVHDSIEAVTDRVCEQVDSMGESLSAVIHSIDEGWEASLMKFTFDLVQNSAQGNLGDFRRQGLL